MNDFDIAGITFASALQWLAGEFSCGDKIADCPHLDASRPEIIFCNVLGDRAAYPAAMAAVHQLARDGCKGMAIHACSPLVIKRFSRQGALVAMKEKIIWRGEIFLAARMIAPPAALAAWLKKTAALVKDFSAPRVSD